MFTKRSISADNESEQAHKEEDEIEPTPSPSSSSSSAANISQDSTQLMDALESWEEITNLSRTVATYVIEHRIKTATRRKRSIVRRAIRKNKRRRLSLSTDVAEGISSGIDSRTNCAFNEEAAREALSKDCEGIKRLTRLFIHMHRAQCAFHQQLANTLAEENDGCWMRRLGSTCSETNENEEASNCEVSLE